MNNEFKSRKSVKSVVESVESVGACPAPCCPVQILQQLVSNIDPELAKSLVGALVNKAADMNKATNAARIRRRDELLKLDQKYADSMKKQQNERIKDLNHLKELECRLENLNEEIELTRSTISTWDRAIRELKAKWNDVHQEWNNGGYAAL